MAKDLNREIDKLKDEHAAEVVTDLVAAYDEKALIESVFYLGRIKQNEHIAIAVSTNLTAQSIRALEHFQQNKMFEPLGYKTFVDFLEKSEHSPMSKRQYYDRLALMNTHGDEIYDLLTSVGISVRSQKMLGRGELAIKGDRLVVGDKEVSIDNAGIVKDVLNELFDDRRELETQNRKLGEKIEKLDATIKQGQDDFDELQRNLDELKSGDPHDVALGLAHHSILDLTYHIGHLSDKKKAEKGGVAMRALWDAIKQVRKSYGLNFNFDDGDAAGTAGISPLAAKVLDEDDDFGDDDEG